MKHLERLVVHDNDIAHGPGANWYERYNALVEIVDELLQIRTVEEVEASAEEGVYNIIEKHLGKEEK